MNYPFSIKLVSDAPENLAIEVNGLGRTALTEPSKAYEFNAGEGNAIHFHQIDADLDIIIENTGTQPFVWEDSVPRTRLSLQPGERKTVRIPKITGALYPNSAERPSRSDYFQTDALELFERPVICLFFAGEADEGRSWGMYLDDIKNSVFEQLRRDVLFERTPNSMLTHLPFSKAAFFEGHYAPADYPIRLIENELPSPEIEKLIRSVHNEKAKYWLSPEQVSALASPMPAEDLEHDSTFSLGQFVGFQYLLNRSKVDRAYFSKKSLITRVQDVDFYIAAPPIQK